MEHEIDIKKERKIGTLLYFLCFEELGNIVKDLMEYRADVNKKNKRG